jgi:hypothetical protein
MPAATPAEARREQAEQHRGPRCADASPADRTAHLLDRTALRGVELSTTAVPSGHGNQEARLRGARLRYVAPEASPAFLEHVIDCHQADVALGLVPADDHDPFALPDSWLAVDVHADHSDLVIELRGHDHEAAAEALRRARLFAGLPAAE